LVSGLFAGSATLATCSRPGALGPLDWLQDELPPGRSDLHDSPTTDCLCTLCSSGVSQAIRDVRTESGRLKNRVNTRGRQYCDDVNVHVAYKYVNGWLSNREPAYLYDTGSHLVAVWAPGA
jgi:hypothetical protein